MHIDLPAFQDALTGDDEARHTFAWLGASYQEQFLQWIKSGMNEVECQTRIQAAVDILAGRDIVRSN
jgi:Bacteriocin-protection, YdeI or OmpD-Associated